MRCNKAKKLIFEFIDKNLSESNRILLETHLAECPGCERDASSLKRSLSILRGLDPVKPGGDFNWQVRLRLAREKNTAGRKLAAQGSLIKHWNMRFAAGAAAGFAIVLISGYFILNSFPIFSGFSKQNRRQAADYSSAPASADAYMPDSWSRPSPGLSSFSGITGQLVSQGNPVSRDEVDSYHPIDSDSFTGVLNPDSLVYSKLRNMRLRHRMHRMEQQIEVLQQYLRQCQEESP